MSRQVSLRDIKLDTIKAAMAYAMVGEDRPEARGWAVRKWGEAFSPSLITKADVPAVTVSGLDSGGTSGLVDRELFNAARERALLFRLRGIRRTGWRVRSITSGGATATWVEPGAPIPVHAVDIDNVGLAPAKVAALSVWTEQALESTPGIEALVFADLVKAYVDATDLALFDPANDGSGVAPASITNGAPAIPATDPTDPGAFASDLAALLGAFTGDLGAAYFATSPRVAAALANLPIGRDLGARGGELAGIPTLTSSAMPEGQLTLVDPSSVMAAYDEDLEIETAREGAIELKTDPVNNSVTPTAAQTTSLFQTNCVAIRAIGRVAWEAAKPATASLTGLYPAAAS